MYFTIAGCFYGVLIALLLGDCDGQSAPRAVLLALHNNQRRGTYPQQDSIIFTDSCLFPGTDIGYLVRRKSRKQRSYSIVNF